MTYSYNLELNTENSACLKVSKQTSYKAHDDARGLRKTYFPQNDWSVIKGNGEYCLGKLMSIP